MRAVLGETPFAVVDVETTGIYAGGHDRVIEVAVVRTGPRGDVQEEYSTLVNPQRDIGRTDVHGITAGDVRNAPLFAEIATDVGMRLTGAIVAGHLLRFDLGFLAAEYQRLGVTLPTLPGLCTLHLAHEFLEGSPSRKLGHCCEAVGILHENEHTALGDARATAALLQHLLKCAGGHGLDALGCPSCELPGQGWLPGPPSGRHFGRKAAALQTREERTYLARLVERMSGDEGAAAGQAEYMGMLDRVLEDRKITHQEADALVAAAAAWGMRRNEVLDAHRLYLAALARAALADGVVTPAERRDLEAVCEMLDLNRATLDESLAGPLPRAESRTGCSPTEDLAGRTVCFTGELLCGLNGERITRERAEQLAAEAGLLVKQSVSRKLDLLVVADPDTESGKAQKAREYGTRILAEAAFWRAIGVPVE